MISPVPLLSLSSSVQLVTGAAATCFIFTLLPLLPPDELPPPPPPEPDELPLLPLIVTVYVFLLVFPSLSVAVHVNVTVLYPYNGLFITPLLLTIELSEDTHFKVTPFSSSLSGR